MKYDQISERITILFLTRINTLSYLKDRANRGLGQNIHLTKGFPNGQIQY